MRAYVIVDLGFGDAGKGLLTDFLVRRTGASLVVRYNGGAQAGHNVVAPDGRQHTFSQFGCGSFVPGVRTCISRQVVVHPAALLAEGDLLQAKGVADAFSRLRLSDRALVITPFHQAANRIRELARGAGRHGSCGVGVGEAVEDAREHPEDCLRAGDLLRPDRLRRKLRRIRERERARVVALYASAPHDSRLAREGGIFERREVAGEWIDSIARLGPLGLVVPDETLEGEMRAAETVIFEGAQGVLLDAEAGFHPYTTWSCCTAENALELIAEAAPGSPAFKIGVLRTYAVRHGPGPLPTETDALAAVVSEHNRPGEWQGPVRYGWFDAVLARYALEVAGGVDALALTHLDVLPRLERWNYCPAYRLEGTPVEATIDRDPATGLAHGFHLPQGLPLEQRAIFTQELFTTGPALESCGSDEREVLCKVETLVGKPVGLVSRGPCADQVQVIHPLPA